MRELRNGQARICVCNMSPIELPRATIKHALWHVIVPIRVSSMLNGDESCRIAIFERIPLGTNALIMGYSSFFLYWRINEYLAGGQWRTC